MNVFITGGAGYVGRAITRELVSAGHRVAALARTEGHETLLRSNGASPVRGDLRDPRSYRQAAESSDAVIHLAVPSGPDRPQASRLALHALLESARSGRAHTFVYTSVLFVLGDTKPDAGEDTPVRGELYADRAALEHEVLAASDGRLACSVLRPGMVYGGGEGGSVSELFRGAVTDGVVRHVGRGENRWPLIHRRDVATLFRLVMEKNAVGIFHATDGSPMRVGDVARLAAAAAGGVRIESIPVEEARSFLGPFADALCLDQPVASPRSLDLGWRPQLPPFTESARTAFEEFMSESRPPAPASSLEGAT